MLYILTVSTTDGSVNVYDSYDFYEIKEIIDEIMDSFSGNDVISFNFEIKEDE